MNRQLTITIKPENDKANLQKRGERKSHIKIMIFSFLVRLRIDKLLSPLVTKNDTLGKITLRHSKCQETSQVIIKMNKSINVRV